MEMEIKNDVLGVVTLKGDATECAEVLNKVLNSESPRDDYPRRDERKERKVEREELLIRGEEFPKRVTRVQPRGKHPKKFLHKKWSVKDVRAIRGFYGESENHFKNGYVVTSKLVAFAQSINRSVLAVRLKALKLGITRRKIKGPHKMVGTKWTSEQKKKHVAVRTGKKWTLAQRRNLSEAMRQSYVRRKRATGVAMSPEQRRNISAGMRRSNKTRAATAKITATKETIKETTKATKEATKRAERFPSFKMVKVEGDALKMTLKDMMLRNGTMDQQRAIVLGITSAYEWGGFLREMLLKSQRIADYFKMPNKFRIVATGDNQMIVYGVQREK